MVSNGFPPGYLADQESRTPGSALPADDLSNELAQYYDPRYQARQYLLTVSNLAVGAQVLSKESQLLPFPIRSVEVDNPTTGAYYFIANEFRFTILPGATGLRKHLPRGIDRFSVVVQTAPGSTTRTLDITVNEAPLPPTAGLISPAAAGSALPTNAAQETGGNLDLIAAALDDGQETMAGSISVAIASDQSPVPTTAQTNASADGATAANIAEVVPGFVTSIGGNPINRWAALALLGLTGISSNNMPPVALAAFNGATLDALLSGAKSNVSSGAGILDEFPLGVANAVAPALTEARYSQLSLDLFNNLRVAADTRGAGTTTATQVSVLVTTTAIVAARATRQSVTIKNTDATNPIYLQATSSATTAAGFVLKAGESVTLRNQLAINGISTGGTVVAAVWEEWT